MSGAWAAINENPVSPWKHSPNPNPKNPREIVSSLSVTSSACDLSSRSVELTEVIWRTRSVLYAVLIHKQHQALKKDLFKNEDTCFGTKQWAHTDTQVLNKRLWHDYVMIHDYSISKKLPVKRPWLISSIYYIFPPFLHTFLKLVFLSIMQNLSIISHPPTQLCPFLSAPNCPTQHAPHNIMLPGTPQHYILIKEWLPMLRDSSVCRKTPTTQPCIFKVIVVWRKYQQDSSVDTGLLNVTCKNTTRSQSISSYCFINTIYFLSSKLVALKTRDVQKLHALMLL